jgi:hypothetical protein
VAAAWAGVAAGDCAWVVAAGCAWAAAAAGAWLWWSYCWGVALVLSC